MKTNSKEKSESKEETGRIKRINRLKDILIRKDSTIVVEILSDQVVFKNCSGTIIASVELSYFDE